jgi:hypothetical protein
VRAFLAHPLIAQRAQSPRQIGAIHLLRRSHTASTSSCTK